VNHNHVLVVPRLRTRAVLSPIPHSAYWRVIRLGASLIDTVKCLRLYGDKSNERSYRTGGTILNGKTCLDIPDNAQRQLQLFITFVFPRTFVLVSINKNLYILLLSSVLQ
jgi:hypothetical protein